MGASLIVEYAHICIGACAFAYFVFEPIATYWLALSNFF